MLGRKINRGEGRHSPPCQTEGGRSSPARDINTEIQKIQEAVAVEGVDTVEFSIFLDGTSIIFLASPIFMWIIRRISCEGFVEIFIDVLP